MENAKCCERLRLYIGESVKYVNFHKWIFFVFEKSLFVGNYTLSLYDA